MFQLLSNQLIESFTLAHAIHTHSTDTHTGEVAETKCHHKNEWENASQIPAILEKTFELQKQDNIERADWSCSQWFGDIRLTPVHWVHLG